MKKGINNITKKNILLSIFLVLTVAIVGTLAWLTYRTEDSTLVLVLGDYEEVVVTVSKYKFNGTLGMATDSNYADDVSDGNYIEVTAVNEHNNSKKIDLYFEVNQIAESLISENVRFAITRGYSQNGTFEEQFIGNFSSITTTDTGDNISNFTNDSNIIPAFSDTVAPNSTYYYRVYIYMNSSADTTAMQGKTLNAEFRAEVSASSAVPAPELDAGMIPVVIDNSGSNTVVKTISSTDENWYDYDDKKWANVVLVTESSRDTYLNTSGVTINQNHIIAYYVWVPRYKYKIQTTSLSSAGNEKSFEIKFESNEVAKSNGTSIGSWKTHPAFTFGNQELNGIWVGKFETSAVSGVSLELDECTGDCTVPFPQIRPNVQALTGQSVSKQFQTSLLFSGGILNTTTGDVKFKGNTIYGLSANIDSHMMKNSEWGAVAYLAHSSYGIDSELFVNNSSDLYTGRSGGAVSGLVFATSGGSYTWDGKSVNETTIGGYASDRTFGTKASTTGNITGIYDMSGGSYDRVMGVSQHNDEHIKTGFSTTAHSGFVGYIGNTLYTTIDSSDLKALPVQKYYDRYTDSVVLNACAGKICFGQALSETNNWYSGELDFPYNYPWAVRGGTYNESLKSGIFYISSSVGDNKGNYTFRSVIIKMPSISSITFDANGGNMAGISQLYVKNGKDDLYTDSDATILGNIPTVVKTDYYFKGWYSKATGGVKVLNADGTFTGDAVGGFTSGSVWNLDNNKILYAQYTDDVHSEDILNGAIPELYDGLIPITINNTGGTTLVKTVSPGSSNWYSYEDKKWANAVLVTNSSRSHYVNTAGVTISEDDILAYYVWIPRFKYKIQTTSTSTAGSESSFEIVFEDINVASSNGTTVGSWKSHPGFTFGAVELNGFWVGKFNTTGTNDKPTIKPNLIPIKDSVSNNFVTSLKIAGGNFNSSTGNIAFSNANSYGMTVETDSHMMKNNEYGAIAYLSHSVYGINSQIFKNNSSSYYTGRSGGSLGSDVTNSVNGTYTWDGKVMNGGTIGNYSGDRTLGSKASTTGNVYGVYDTAGIGTYVMAAYQYDNNNIYTGNSTSNNSGFVGYIGSTLYNAINGDNLKALPNQKYYDRYSSDSVASNTFGHSYHETYNWYSSQSSSFANGSMPWLIRGNGNSSFDFNQVDGGTSYPFRSILVVNGSDIVTTISFNQNGCTGGQSDNVIATYGDVLSSITASNASCGDGYTFLGWFDNDTNFNDASKYYDANGNPLKVWDKRKDTILYMGKEGKLSQVSFDVNGGSGNKPSNVSARYGSEMPDINNVAPTYTGYTFLGWFDSATDFTTSHKYYNADGTSAKNFDKTSATTLYAGWLGGNVSVTYSGANSLTVGISELKGGDAISSHYVGYSVNSNCANATYVAETAYTAKTFMNVPENTYYGCVKFNDNLTVASKTAVSLNTTSYSETILNGAIPEVYEGLIPVVIDNSASSTTIKTISMGSSSWYNYGNKKWANAILVSSSSRSKYDHTSGVTVSESDILAYYVWVPRYKYKIQTISVSSAGSESSFNIVFENKNTSKSNGTTVGSYRTHPGFTFGANELNGIWVGKFETSASSSSSCYTSASVNNCDNTSQSPRILPNVMSLRYQSISNQFQTALKFSGGTLDTSTGVVTFAGNSTYGLTSSTDSHMMKNSEWGAVAYLAHSTYGINSEIFVNNSSSYYTGRSAGTVAGSSTGINGGTYTWDGIVMSGTSYGTYHSDKSLGTKASTTGNITGIYDMSGGSSDRVMGVRQYNANYIGTGYSTSSHSGFVGYIGDTLYSSIDSTSLKAVPNQKYYDRYTTSTGSTSCNGGICFGHAISETAYWYNATIYVASESYPWYSRGGYINQDLTPGLFNRGTSSGINLSNNTFRSVLSEAGTNPAISVSFNRNCAAGSGGQSSSVTATHGFAMPSISTTKPTCAGFTFMGWYDNADYTKGTQYYTASGSGARLFDKTSNTTLYAGWKENTITIKYKTNGGTITKNTDVWTADSNGLIHINGEVFEQVLKYTDSLPTYGLQNWNDEDNLYILRDYYHVVETQEWKCLSGNCTAGTVYDHDPTATTGYTPSTFCDASVNSCEVVLGVNWEQNYLKFSFNVNGGNITSSTTSDAGTTYSWSKAADGTVKEGGNILYYNYNSGDSVDLPNYNYNKYLHITKTGHSAVSGSEWKCLSGDCTVGTAYSHSASDTTGYTVQTFCPNIATKNCNIHLGVNWEADDISVTLDKGTGISTIYYKRNCNSDATGCATSSWESTTSDKTISVTYGKYYFVYATPATGYTYANNSDSTKLSYTMNSASAQTHTYTGTPISYSVTLTKSTGISKIYYKVKGQSSYSSTTSASTSFDVPFNSEYYIYATPSTGYSYSVDTAAEAETSANKHTMDSTSGKTHTITGTVNSYTLTLTIGTGISKIYYKVNGASSYSSTSSSTTVQVKYNTKYYVYATSSTGYTYSFCTSSSPCEYTMDSTSGKTYNPSSGQTNGATINKLTVQFDTNGGVVTANTVYDGTDYAWTTDSDGIISRNGVNTFFKYSYGETKDLVNMNSTNYLYIARKGYFTSSTAQWKCLSGCCTAGTTYNQNTEYEVSDICSVADGNKTAVLGVNWSAIGVNVSSTSSTSITVSMKSTSTTRTGVWYFGYSNTSSADNCGNWTSATENTSYTFSELSGGTYYGCIKHGNTSSNVSKVISSTGVDLTGSPVGNYLCNASANNTNYYLVYTGPCSVAADGSGWKAQLYGGGVAVGSSNTYTLYLNDDVAINAFLVGGGGGGGSSAKSQYRGGGGGGGGYTRTFSKNLTAGTAYSIKIGGGGAGGASSGDNDGGNGVSTVAFDNTARGGYGGENANQSDVAYGGHGGSGGGVGGKNAANTDGTTVNRGGNGGARGQNGGANSRGHASSSTNGGMGQVNYIPFDSSIWPDGYGTTCEFNNLVSGSCSPYAYSGGGGGGAGYTSTSGYTFENGSNGSNRTLTYNSITVYPGRGGRGGKGGSSAASGVDGQEGIVIIRNKR